jgi:orotate phosphoribosyltransferase
MNFIKENFIRLAIENKVLQFGNFTLKSGRISPYFFNAGLFYQGTALKAVGQAYAHTLLENQVDFDHLFGPAYKGLPLATTTAIALADANKPVTVTFNRKEEKDHGEGGQLIGGPLSGNTVIIDDVITAGTAFRQAQSLINTHGGKLKAVIIALDRGERGLGSQSALSEIQMQGIAVYAIITVFDLIAFLYQEGEDEKAKAIEMHLEKYGVA